MPNAAAVTAGNPFLEGNFGPIMEEHDIQDMEVRGSIPKDLEGNFLRIGPNPVHIFSVETYHTFDGDGMIHSIEFSAGTARYRNRFVQTEGFKLEQETGDWVWKGMLSMLDPTPARVPEGMPGTKNLANTAFVFHNKTLYALHEPSQPTVIGLPNLDTRGTSDFDGKLTHSFTAHPKVDPHTGEMMTFGSSFEAPYVNYSVISATGELVHTTPINIPKPIFMHDFAVTENHSLFLDFPITLDIERAMAGGPALGFDAEHGSRIGVLPRFGNDADVRWFEVEVGVVIHTANAWEEGRVIVLQAARSKTTNIIGAGEALGDDPTETQGQLYQWRIDLDSGEVEEGLLCDVHCDFTRINEKYSCRKNRYVYGAIFHPTRPLTFNGVVKYDNDTGAKVTYEYGANRFGGEAVFAPRVNSQSEDDGYIISFIHDETAEQSECLIIDALDLAAGPVATLMIPHRVPYGFHAGWVAA
ncbi:9-cis-epoxycarotenoid dioxygenase [Halieaceae bacterium IMCC14734]|uniref:9-cis-epoxycarotenoid dioxygenase n=1 Tax=Candidatus Litorirhabdus singularis TaxID=2518993 RepID=A0ABT3TJN9_9GAMM|nr:carotenoid oxygenase family protein [Candidatus Litorirhabdus singularis]MCX2982522.1 9-cis-epoxycarotenoid dioxygenase [Candidatus Litorirhabdus singularis]